MDIIWVETYEVAVDDLRVIRKSFGIVYRKRRRCAKYFLLIKRETHRKILFLHGTKVAEHMRFMDDNELQERGVCVFVFKIFKGKNVLIS